MGIINIVEPTLKSEIGHCYSFIDSVCKAGIGAQWRVWANRSVTVWFDLDNVRIEPYFYRKIRRLQCFFLYRRLLQSGDKLFVSTATVMDLFLLHWAARGELPLGRVYLYFHWLQMSERKLSYLQKIARLQPNFMVFGPVPSVIEVLLQAGFKQACLVPYPIVAAAKAIAPVYGSAPALLYAGAARQDKGISHVVALVSHMSNLGLTLPVRLQCSPNHHEEYDALTAVDMHRLAEMKYPQLQKYSGTLAAKEYANLFIGVICLQLYDRLLFADRISGVTLDALSAGSPIITTAGSWIARMVSRFDAGIVVDSPAPEVVLMAVDKILADFPGYQANAHAAGLTLRQENSGDLLFKALTA
jgi:hypothetical protein